MLEKTFVIAPLLPSFLGRIRPGMSRWCSVAAQLASVVGGGTSTLESASDLSCSQSPPDSYFLLRQFLLRPCGPKHYWHPSKMKQARRKSLRNRSANEGEEYGEPVTKKAKGHSRVGKGGIPQLNPFVEMLKEATVEQAVPIRKVAVLDVTNTVSEALKLLAEYGIQSAPVIDLVQVSFLGFVDVLDILVFIVGFFQQGETIDSGTLFARSQDLFTHPITDVIGMSHRLSAVDIHKTTSLWDTIAIFQKGAHRLPITNEDGVIVNLISQTDVLRFLMSQRDYYDNLFDSTIEDLKLGRHPAFTCHQDQTTIAALQKMQKGNVSALAIVNGAHELVGNLSASDLKGSVVVNDDPGSEPLGCLLLPVLAFLHQNGKKYVEPFCCTHKSTLGSILEPMLELGYHRVWVVDDTNRVKSVITITDVMRAVIQQKPKFFNEEQKANKAAQQRNSPGPG